MTDQVTPVDLSTQESSGELIIETLADQDNQDGDELEAVATPETAQAITRAFQDLANIFEEFGKTVFTLQCLVEGGNFKHLSKASRNDYLNTLINKSGELTDVTKVAFRLLKKIKRERPAEELVDKLLITDAITDAVASNE